MLRDTRKSEFRHHRTIIGSETNPKEQPRPDLHAMATSMATTRVAMFKLEGFCTSWQRPVIEDGSDNWSKSLKRRLAAIVALDVVGYSTLVEKDEDAAITAVSSVLSGIMQPLSVSRAGRIFKTTGDGAFIVFDSALQAVCFAVEFQRDLRNRNALPPLAYRIGINLGDVVFENDDVFGDGVNIAARLEGQADPGGITISRSVRDQVRNRLQLDLEEMGQLVLKNISTPIAAFRIVLGDGAVELPPPDHAPRPGRVRRGRSWIFGGAAAIVVVGTLAWLLQADLPFNRPASGLVEARADRPILAVTAFRDLTEAPDQSYFAEGVASDVITELSRFDELMVVAAPLPPAGAAGPADRARLAETLGSRYLLEGTVRRADARIRVKVQLIEAGTGRTLWGETFETQSADVFDVQDRIVRNVVVALVQNVNDAELGRVGKTAPSSLAAYELLLRGRAAARGLTRADLLEAREHFRSALAIEPDYASAASELGFTYFFAVAYGWAPSPNSALERAAKLARRSLELDPSSVDGHRLLGRILQFRGEYEPGLAELETA